MLIKRGNILRSFSRVLSSNSTNSKPWVKTASALITAGPPGTTGYAAGRPRVQPVFRYWPCLIERDGITPRVEVLPSSAAKQRQDSVSGMALATGDAESMSRAIPAASAVPLTNSRLRPRLSDIATARSGDKGIHANIGVIARRANDFEWLCREVTVERVAAHFGIDDLSRIQRFELPNLSALNFVIRGILANSLRVDAQGKTLGQILLQMPLT